MRLLTFFTVLLLSQPLSANCDLDLQNNNRSEVDKQRDATSLPCDMARLIKINKGDVVLDLLGGSGYFSELLAGQVGQQGQVYLHNNKAYLPYVEKQLTSRLQNNRLPNVIRLDAELDQLALKPDSLDAVYFVMGYHDMYHVSEGWKIDPQQLMAKMYSALKPGGQMLVVDHNAPAGSGVRDAQELHRIDANYVEKELQQFGFKLLKRSDVLKNPSDDYSKSVFDAAVRGKTDRFVLVVKKPEV